MEHEKLICYRQLTEVAEELGKSLRRWSSGNSELADQLKRALISAVLNLAEGNGKWGFSKERRRFFQMSMGSMSEAAACIDLASCFDLIPRDNARILKEKLRASYYRVSKLP
jgi:four helix bundle protein